MTASNKPLTSFFNEPFRFWLRLLGLSLALTPAVVLTLISLLFVSTRFFNLRIEDGQVSLGTEEQTIGLQATVESTSGFQNSRVYLKQGEKVILEPEGRIHLASDHLYNFARAAKPLIVNGVPDPQEQWPEEILQKYPMPRLTERNTFYRDWVGPEGDSYPSDILEECKLRRELNWGSLLAVVIPDDKFSAQTDPWEVLSTNSIEPNQLVQVTGRTEFVADRDGWLTFIVNEAVISALSPSQDSREYYDALKRMSQDMSNNPSHRIPMRAIPLVWFSDNAGAFRVKISR
jgi:hypothetical protein